MYNDNIIMDDDTMLGFKKDLTSYLKNYLNELDVNEENMYCIRDINEQLMEMASYDGDDFLVVRPHVMGGFTVKKINVYEED